MDLFSHISRLMVLGSSKEKKKLLGGHGSIHLRIAQNVFYSSYYHCTTNKMWPSTSTTCLNPTKSLLRHVYSFRLIFCEQDQKEHHEHHAIFLFSWAPHLLATYIFTAPTCTTNYYNYLESNLVNPRLSISYPDSIKFPYFADLTQRGG